MNRPAFNAVAAGDVKRFNKAHPVGTAVLAWTGVIDPNVKPLGTLTRSEAFVLGGHTAVVFVEGVSGCIALTHVQVVPK